MRLVEGARGGFLFDSHTCTCTSRTLSSRTRRTLSIGEDRLLMATLTIEHLPQGKLAITTLSVLSSVFVFIDLDPT